MSKNPNRKNLSNRKNASNKIGRDLTVRVKSARGRKHSSTRWLQRQLNDPYVVAAQRAGLRSRSAFKLEDLDNKFKFLKSNMRIIELGAAPGGWTLQWRGCALPPGDPFINDVVALSDGGFLVTHMWNKSIAFEEVGRRLLNGEKMGWVWEWQAESGFSFVANSQQVMPNGITVSADNEKIFINVYMGNKIIKLDRASGMLESAFDVRQPDNVTIDDDGMLWIASHQHDPLNESCTAEQWPCLLPFQVVRVDSETMLGETVIDHQGAPMGYVTVALKVGDEIFMGSAHGDRLARTKLN